MDVDVVDPKTGEQVPINRIMLHHVVFTRIGNARANLLRQAFYRAGGERATMSLPPGYGYPVRGDDQWAIIWMLMNHRADDDSVLIRYYISSDRLHDGRQFSQKLTKPGTYQLFCSPHPTQMNEQIVVRR
jgi:hypothetical protein